MQIDDLLSKVKTAAIFGHVRPDGDCVGSTTGIYNYIQDNYPNVKVDLFLEKFQDCFKMLRYTNKAKEFSENCESYDLIFVMDTPTFERIGANGALSVRKAKITVNVDHHVSNSQNMCTINFVEPNASSASEVLYGILDSKKISKETAACLYLGIVHDTGAFKFSCTGKRTMQIVGNLIEKGIDFTKIINETYYTRTYDQTLITGYVMQNCKLALLGKAVYAYVTQSVVENFGVTPVALSNIVDTLREVQGTELTIFVYPVNGKNKISMRSNYFVDVNAIAKEFGGGGHVRAAGADTDLEPMQAIDKILALAKLQLK